MFSISVFSSCLYLSIYLSLHASLTRVDGAGFTIWVDIALLHYGIGGYRTLEGWTFTFDFDFFDLSDCETAFGNG